MHDNEQSRFDDEFLFYEDSLSPSRSERIKQVCQVELRMVLKVAVRLNKEGWRPAFPLTAHLLREANQMAAGPLDDEQVPVLFATICMAGSALHAEAVIGEHEPAVAAKLLKYAALVDTWFTNRSHHLANA